METVNQVQEFGPKELRFAQLLGMPAFMIAHLDSVADPIEVELVVRLGEGGLTVPQVAEALQMPLEEATELLERAFCREVVNREEKDGETIYTVATFFRRMDVMGTFETEAWNRLPAEVLGLADQWYSKAYAEHWQEAIDQIKIDPDHLPRHIGGSKNFSGPGKP